MRLPRSVPLVKILVRPVYVGGAGCEANAMLIASRFQVPNWDGWRVITFNSCYCKVLWPDIALYMTVLYIYYIVWANPLGENDREDRHIDKIAKMFFWVRASTLVLQQRLVHTIQLATFAYFRIFFADPCQPFSLANPKNCRSCDGAGRRPSKRKSDGCIRGRCVCWGHGALWENPPGFIYIYIYIIGTSQTLLKTEFWIKLGI